MFFIHRRKLLYFSFLFLLTFLLSLTACSNMKGRKYLVGDLFEVKPPAEDAVMVAVLPVQNATLHPIRITGKKGFIDNFMENILGDKLHFKYSQDDIAYVQKTLQLLISQRLYNSGFRVLEPEKIYAVFAELGLQNSESGLNIEDMTPSMPADWLLLVTLTDWEVGNFDYRGRGRFSYQTVLIDTRLKQAVWQKERKNLIFEAPSKSIPYNRQGGETLNEVGRMILKNFPKPEKITDYQTKKPAEPAKAEGDSGEGIVGSDNKTLTTPNTSPLTTEPTTNP
jgi:hypothetical protein